jgi:hypothetical protein
LAIVYLVPGILRRLATSPLAATCGPALESAWICYTAAHQVAGAVVAACIVTGMWAAWAMPVLSGGPPSTSTRLAFIALRCGALAVSATPVASANVACRAVRHLGQLALAAGGTAAAEPMLMGADRPDCVTLGRLTYAAVACGTLGLWIVATVGAGPTLTRGLEYGSGVLLYSAPVAMQVLVNATPQARPRK